MEVYITRSLVDVAKVTFQSLDEFMEYHNITLNVNTIHMPLDCLYEIYCEQSDNLLDFGTFCAILTNNKSRKTHIYLSCNNPDFFRERTITYVYRQKKETRFRKIPSFKS